MPIYEYKCTRCGQITSFLEKVNERRRLWARRKIRRCKGCGSKRLTKLISSFSVSKKESTADMLNELRRMGPVNFVPDYRMPGPPPGGCPYAKKETDSSEKNNQS